jgi:hypothetical protein
MSGTTYDNAIFDESTINPYIRVAPSYSALTTTTGYGTIAPSSFKVPLSTNVHTTAIEGRLILKVAKSYKSYITNTYNATHSTIEYYFNDKDDAVHFAKVYNAVAYEYN